jgi:acetoin utilization deacetylase AcuC-like enzyme
MTLFYADHFVLPLPDGHRFPMEKYARLRHALQASSCFDSHDFCEPPAATDAQIERAHDANYVYRATQGLLDTDEIRRIGFPWSEGMIERSRRSAGATIEAARTALTQGWAANLAGGTHHAHAQFGSGFCVFNDAAIAARAMQVEEGIDHVAIIDCDVHQGDGTASIFATDDSVFTFSMHGAKNFPFRKHASDLDIELADGTTDATYLSLLNEALPQIFVRSQPQLVIYLAGADPYEGDRLGRLSITQQGLKTRDEMVLRACKDRGVPVAIAMAGGYAYDISRTVHIHATTVLTAHAVWS